MIIEINALDTLFFKDGKPFTMGEETWANGVFPPYPSVIYGALRSAYFAEHIDELKKANDKRDPTKELKINRISLKINREVCFPLPLDCVKEKDSNKNESFLLSSKLTNGLISSYPELEKILIYPDNDKNNKIENIFDALLSDLYFKNYLKDHTNNIRYYEISKLLLSEPKIGIGRSYATHSIEEGKIYRVDMRRSSNKKNDKVSIIVDFEGLNLPERGLMKLGGEGKAASYKKYNDSTNIEFPKFENDEKQFKVVLTTPTIFKKGWIPGWIDEKTLENNCEFEKGFKCKDLKLKLLTAAIGKPVYIGGFDMKKRKPKPMYKAVPAGSVYYFEIIEGDVEKAIEIFHRKAISDIYPEQGFGIAFVGKNTKRR